MKKVALVLSLILCLLASGAENKSWQRLSNPSAQAVAAQFQSPPPEYAVTLTWGWDGPVTEEVIVRDLERVSQWGFRAVTIEAGYQMNAPYLSEGWFELVRFAVGQAKTRGMKVWIIDEGKYPSGFAGGLFTQKRPDLRMQGLLLAETIDCDNGSVVTHDLADKVVGVIAVNSDTGMNQTLDISSHKIHWTVPGQGRWQLAVVTHDFRTPVTRAVNDPSGAKSRKNSVGDLINPIAVKQFITWTHEQYKKYLGDELGTTVMGFRGDEPEFEATPWTEGIVECFKEKKGYDVTPYLPYLASMGRRGPRVNLTDAQRRAKADYWDLWSELYGKHFFGLQARWCADNGVEHLTHLNNEHNLEALTRTSGDYFRDLKEVQIPGVDSIWNQVWPGKNADFVRLPASVAHVYGKARVLSESYAAYNESPITVETAQWGANYQLVRGVNLFEFMFYSASSRGLKPMRGAYGYFEDPAFPAAMAAINRTCYVMSQGRSDAKIAMYFPSLSFWVGDFKPNEAMWTLADQLLQQQRDFDFVDDEAFASVMKLEGSRFINLSGQGYEAVILPNVSAISKAALDRLIAFAKGGGKVVLLGDAPSMVVEKTFMDAESPTDLSWAVHQRDVELTQAVLAALPAPDVSLDSPCATLKVMHKKWKEADLYFLFNEITTPVSRKVTLTGQGTARHWDTQNGTIKSLSGIVQNNTVTLDLTFAPYEAKLVVLGRE